MIVGSWVEGRSKQAILIALASVASAACGGGGDDSGAPPMLGAAPAISGVSGTLVHGQAVTISGTAFGSKSHPGPMLWDNFEGGSNGAVLANDTVGAAPAIHQGNLAGYSKWLRDGGGNNFHANSIFFNNSATKPNSALHARVVFNSTDPYALDLYVPYSQFTTGKELYFSFYYRMTKSGAMFPRQTKAWVVYDSTGSGWQDKLYWSTAYDNCESDGYRTHITELGPQEHLFSTGGVTVNGEWVRFESYLKQSGPNVSNGTWEQAFYRPSLGSPSKEFYSVTNQKLRTSADDFVNWTFGGAYYSMCGSSDTGTVDVDDIYMDDSRARVEVCDAATWSASKRCELQVPTAWSDTSITATFNKGYLDSSKPAYVYVIEPGGNANSVGFAINLP